MRKNCSSDREKLLKFKAEGREFANVLRSLGCGIFVFLCPLVSSKREKNIQTETT